MIEQTYLQILGCGHSESLHLFNNNAVVVSPEGRLLIDCGYTIKHALAAQCLTVEDIDAIYISHVHGDHVFGLERFAYETKFKYQKKVKLIFHASLYEELWHQTLKGSLGSNSDGPANLEDYFDVILVEDDDFSIFGNDFQLVQTDHVRGKPGYGLNINHYLYYSSDTAPILEAVSGLIFSVGFHDVTLMSENSVHASLNGLLSEYPEAIRKKLYLMSYEDEFHSYQKIVDQAFRGFAQQGMKIDIPKTPSQTKLSQLAMKNLATVL